MLQRELAARLVAAPGSAGYGAPSVLVRQVADARIRFAVPAAAFVPRPRVDSAVVGLAFLREPRFPVGWDELRAVVRLAFRFRRKTLRRALAAEHPAAQVELALAAAELDGRRRGETLELEEFARLARALADGERGAAP
jgi:16S rRNA (adenine1518-N6/adenine1519-N6)-dimethyltransferase